MSMLRMCGMTRASNQDKLRGGCWLCWLSVPIEAVEAPGQACDGTAVAVSPRLTKGSIVC